MPFPTNKVLENVLDYSALKQKVIAQNIANSETIGYKRRDVEFKDLFNKGINEPLQLKGATNKSKLKIVIDESSENISGFNNVDVNREMAELAENTIMFKFSAKKINAYFKSLQSVIKGGR